MQRIFKAVGTFCFIIILFSARFVQAGMSSVVLTEYGRERLIGLSTALFFGLVVSTALIYFFWGLLVSGTEWTKPTVMKSLATTFLGGLLFFIVLVMIAGSRELFSPGAWVPDGILYKLSTAQPAEHEPIDPALNDIPLARRLKIETLRDRLKATTELPREIHQSEIEAWTVPFSSGMLYEYHPTGDGPYLVEEPKVLEEKRFAIERGSFEVVEIPSEEATP